jgi:hypothetical protein
MHKAVNDFGIKVKNGGYSGPEWRDACAAKLPPHADQLALQPGDFLLCDSAKLVDGVGPDRQVAWQFSVVHIAPDYLGHKLLHNYGELSEYIGPHYTTDMQTGMDSDLRAGYKLDHIFTTLLDAAKTVAPCLPNVLARQERAV